VGYEEIMEEMKKFWDFLKMKAQPIRTYGALQGSAEGKFVGMNAYIKSTEKFQINDLMLHLKLLRKPEKAKLKTSK
jgi:hypothetical protein